MEFNIPLSKDNGAFTPNDHDSQRKAWKNSIDHECIWEIMWVWTGGDSVVAMRWPRIADRVSLARELITARTNGAWRARNKHVAITASVHSLSSRARICPERKKCCSNMRYMQKTLRIKASRGNSAGVQFSSRYKPMLWIERGRGPRQPDMQHL